MARAAQTTAVAFGANPIAAAAASAAHAAAEEQKKANLLPLQGNTETANMDDRLYRNIQESHFFKTLCVDCKSFEEVIEKADESIKYINAWGDQVWRTWGKKEGEGRDQARPCEKVAGMGSKFANLQLSLASLYFRSCVNLALQVMSPVSSQALAMAGGSLRDEIFFLLRTAP